MRMQEDRICCTKQKFFRLLFTYPPLVASRLPDRKRASTPKTPRDSVVRRTFLTKAPPRDVCRCSSIVNTFYTFPFQCWDMSDFTDKYKCGCVGFVSSSFIIVSVPVGFQSIQYWISPVFYDIIFAILVSREYLNMITPMQIDSSPNLSIKIN